MRRLARGLSRNTGRRPLLRCGSRVFAGRDGGNAVSGVGLAVVIVMAVFFAARGEEDRRDEGEDDCRNHDVWGSDVHGTDSLKLD